MMNEREYDRCRFCEYYSEDDCHYYKWYMCDKHNLFEADVEKIKAKAKAEGMSIADVVALISLGDDTDG